MSPGRRMTAATDDSIWVNGTVSAGDIPFINEDDDHDDDAAMKGQKRSRIACII